MLPHMHRRGTSLVSWLHPQAGPASQLLAVPRFDPNWHTVHTLAKRVPVVAGDRVQVRAVWDNSRWNLANPNPRATVRYGMQMTEEMMESYLFISVPRSGQASYGGVPQASNVPQTSDRPLFVLPDQAPPRAPVGVVPSSSALPPDQRPPSRWQQDDLGNVLVPRPVAPATAARAVLEVQVPHAVPGRLILRLLAAARCTSKIRIDHAGHLLATRQVSLASGWNDIALALLAPAGQLTIDIELPAEATPARLAPAKWRAESAAAR